jgi:coenzyme F420-reducing hydrogenase gamma subunit
MSPKLRIAYQRYTSCGGCQLTLLNCEGELALIEKFFAIAEFSMLSSCNDSDCPLDVALVEGSITTPEELQRLLTLRRRARILIAVGACALSGGVNALAQGRDLLLADSYGAESLPLQTFSAQPVASFVRVDAEIPGCPPEVSDYLRLLGILQKGGLPGEYAVPVCMECRLRENRCLLVDGKQPCLGPVTRGGCLARCPSYGAICEGCRGMVPEANFTEHFQLLLQTGLTATEVRGRLEHFFWRYDEGY